MQLINMGFVLYDTLRLALQKTLSWAVVWSRWCRARNRRLFLYTVSIGAQNLLETKFVYNIFMLELTLNFHPVLLFSSCLEWRYGYPLLEESGFETWAVDILGWGFSDLGVFYYFACCVLFIYPFLFEVFCAFNSKFSFIHQKIFLLVTWCRSAITSIRFWCIP